MNMPLTRASTRRAHPMLIVASGAVVLVCLAGTAALMGWIPTSASANLDTAALAPANPALPAQQASPATPRHVAPKPLAYHQPRAEPVRRAATPVCQNCGTVASIREFNTRGDGSGLGAAGGAVVGGLLGNQVGGGHGKQAMTVVGAIGGALAGNHIEKRVRATQSYETTVNMDNGSSRTVTQATQPTWRQGDQIKIVDGVLHMNG